MKEFFVLLLINVLPRPFLSSVFLAVSRAVKSIPLILSSGGKDSNNNLLNSVEVLQTDGTFTSGPSLPEPIAQHCIEGVDDNRVFMSGGDVVGTNVGNKKAYMYSFVSKVMYAMQPREGGRVILDNH